MSYYEQVSDDATLDFVFCYNAFQWIPEYHPTKYRICYSPSYNVLDFTDKFNNITSKYLTKFLIQRYSELKQGGLISLNFIHCSSHQEHINNSWLMTLKKYKLELEDLDKVMVRFYFTPLEVIQNYIDSFSSKYEVTYNNSDEINTKFCRAAARALLKNKKLACLGQYPTTNANIKLDLRHNFEDSMLSNNIFIEQFSFMKFVY